ncbi:lipopolysaccharide biosynthesis protein [Chitinophaga costaii]|nr:lipopolysaccharide biosynthesis protein [Chitinophaga costaii]
MEVGQHKKTLHQDEVSVKELVLKLRDWYRYLLSKWLSILIVVLIGACLGLLYATFKKAEYEGELTFVVEEGKSSGGLGAYAGIASQFGIDIGGGGSSGVFSGDNILEFLKSRLIVEKTLLEPLISGKDTSSLAEMYIDTYEMRKAWVHDPKLVNLHFIPRELGKGNTRIQDSILNVLFSAIVKKNLVVTKPDKKLSFISVAVTSRAEIFSKCFTERLVQEAITFYVDTKTKRSQTNVNLLQAKADSLEQLLNSKSYAIARSRDMNINPARQLATVETELGTRDKMVLQTMYGEVVKNLEFSRMTMEQETPVIQVIDTPILPLNKVKFGKLKGLIVGGFLAGFFVLVILILRKLYKEALE